MLISRGVRPFVRVCCGNMHLKTVAINGPMTKRKIELCGILARTFAAPKKAVEKVIILKNSAIKNPILRVVYDDEITGKSIHAIMLRNEALDLAAERKLDLILVNLSANPPICRLENYGQLMIKKKEKAKEIRINAKARSLKEMFIGGGIDKHDLGIKMKKVIEFLSNGHPVRIFVTAKKLRLKLEPFCVEETTMKVLEAVEEHVQSVQQPESATASRKDFTLNPKIKKEITQTLKKQSKNSDNNQSEKNEKKSKNDKNMNSNDSVVKSTKEEEDKFDINVRNDDVNDDDDDSIESQLRKMEEEEDEDEEETEKSRK